MTKTVVAVYNDFEKAYNVVDALQRSGFDRADISVVANDASGAYADYLAGGSDMVTNEGDLNAAEGAGFGAIVGGLTGLVVGLGALMIPGIGPVLAAGPIAAALGSTVIGTAAGALTGGVVAGLVDMGVEPVDAELYAESIRRGGTMVAVKTRDEQAQTAADIMQSGQPIDINASASRWREEGWERYTEADKPYQAEHVDRMRREHLVVPHNYTQDYIRIYGYDID